MGGGRARQGDWLAVLLAASVASVASKPAAAPLEAYGRLPAIEQVTISPDGQKIAALITNGERRQILVKEAEGDKVFAMLDAGDQKLRSLRWAGSNHLITTLSRTGYVANVQTGRDEWFMAGVVDLAGRRLRPLLTVVRGEDVMNTIIGDPEVRIVDGRPVVFAEGVVFVEGIGRRGLFRVDLDRGTQQLVSTGLEDTRDYAVAANGDLAAEDDYSAARGRWTLRLWRGGWRVAATDTALNDPPVLIGTGRDGASPLVLSRQNYHTELRELTAAGAWSPPLTPSGGAPLTDAKVGRLIGSEALVGDSTQTTFFDPKDQAIWRGVERAYPGDQVEIELYSDDRRRWVVKVDSPTEGAAFAIVDIDTGKADWLGDLYPGVKAEGIGPVQPVRFKAADGLELGGYLTLPNGRSPKALPLVVLPHGGPAARDEPGFDWWAQALASRGYAVLQVNYRGSAGLGWDLLSAGFGQWGRKMQTDLSDGVRYLADQGVIDRKRVCVVGASYGGYAALAGVTLQTGVYRCAVAVAGPSDLGRMVERDRADEGDGGAGTLRYWTRYMGERAGWDAISPARLAAQASAPILLIHGKDDTVVSYDQSQRMADALRRAGKPAEFVTLASEDHWLSRGATRQAMLAATVAFLEKNNPP